MRQEAPLARQTHVYKLFGTKVELDVYRPGASDGLRPVVVWIHGGALIMGSRHGGALIMGSRAGVPGQLLDLCHDCGFALVSIDHRLAPQVRLPAIVADVRDASGWLRTDGPAAAHARAKAFIGEHLG